MEKLCYLAGLRNSLFKQIVASLLRDLTEDLNLHESQNTDIESLLTEISEVKPDMILLEDASPFSRDSLLMRLLINMPGIPVIVISEDSNALHIVRTETRLLRSSTDLIKAIDQIQAKTELPVE